MPTLYKNNHAVRVRKNGERFTAMHICNIEGGLDSATVLQSKSFGTLKGAEKWGNKTLERE